MLMETATINTTVSMSILRYFILMSHTQQPAVELIPNKMHITHGNKNEQLVEKKKNEQIKISTFNFLDIGLN